MDTFCEDISAMFDVEMETQQQQSVSYTVKDLKKQYKKLAAVYSVNTKGTLTGSFHIIFNKEGLFTLAGIIVMQPEPKIQENRKRGAIKEAEDLGDAVGEAGNLLVGSWDRIFREGLDGHGHFVQSGTFIGDPWDKPDQNIGHAEDEEFLFVPFTMTVGSYSAFDFGAIFPKDIFAAEAETDENKTQQQPETDSEEPEAIQEQHSDESQAQQSPADEETVEQAAGEEATNNEEAQTDAEEAQAGAEEAQAGTENAQAGAEDVQAGAGEAQNDAGEQEDQAQEFNPAEQSPTESTSNEHAEAVSSEETQQKAISETIKKMADSPAILPGEYIMMSLNAPVLDIMCQEVVWGVADDTVEQAIAKMQQSDAGYMLIGQDGKLEGLVSKSDLAGAVSPYLRPAFTKWRRPIDDATLQIKIKWIMSRPVRTVTPETTLAAVMENMREFGGRCLPVIDQQGQVVGLITVFDIFKALIEANTKISTVGKTLQAPPLI